MKGMEVFFYGIMCMTIGSGITALFDRQQAKAVFFAIFTVLAAIGMAVSA